MLHSGRLGRKHFDLNKQIAMIQGHGSACLITPCLQCPCLLEDRQFSPTCFACHGTGRLYLADQAFSTTLLLHHEDSKRTFEEAGTWTMGTILASVLPDVRLYDRDKVRVLDILDTFNDEVLTQGLDDTVRFTSGVHVLLVADRQRIYRETLDYVLTPPATITWVAGGLAPGLGQQYSIKYEAQAEYLVVEDSPRLRVEYHVPQSSEVRLQRLDRLSEEF